MKTRLLSLLLTASVFAASWGALFSGWRSWADGG
jgi:hypothetical protein